MYRMNERSLMNSTVEAMQCKVLVTVLSEKKFLLDI